MRLTDLAKEFAQHKTPFYYYDLNILESTLKELTRYSNEFGYKVHYAIKANVNKDVLELIRSYGLGADCVSGGEVQKALDAGFSNKHIVFAGVGKTDEEIELALQSNIFCFNCESIEELEVINEIAARIQRTAPVALRINPHVAANTHHYITTGLEENKFGINFPDIPKVLSTLKALKNISLEGLHFHIGSQVTDLTSFKNLCNRVNEIQKWFISQKILVKHLNVGGGLGINYYEPDQESIPPFKQYFQLFHELLEVQPNQQVHFELGRSIVGQCGSLITKVIYVKKGTNKEFVIVDAGMTELIRPALYQAYHKIENISNPNGKLKAYDVVGPICESSDCFAKQLELPETKRGDLIALRSAGAYGEVMTSSYNLRPKVQSVVSKRTMAV